MLSHRYRKWYLFMLLIAVLAGCAVVLYFKHRDVVLRSDILLEEGWKFFRGDAEGAEDASFDASSWQDVTVPHDWAIYGPFDKNNDLQVVKIVQNMETVASEKTGRSGGLPYMGVGWYRTSFDIPHFNSDKCVTLLFDGAMSQPQVWVNGQKAGEWKLGYNSFFLDISEFINHDGKENVLAVRVENLEQSSRWYPGAGLYRNVHLITTRRTHIPVWGTRVTTTSVDSLKAEVEIQVAIENPVDDMVVVTDVLNSHGRRVTTARTTLLTAADTIRQVVTVNSPELWSPETPAVYTAVTRIRAAGREVDDYRTRFGIRTIEVVPEKGFVFNGQVRKFKGVCNHHDLGPLGAAVNRSAIRHQLEILKDMGCNAIRTSHNMPAPELVELCDEMGFFMMVEAFDEWDIAKCENGYHLFFDEWAEKDMVNMIRHFRNNPSVVMWSIGNEVPTQCADRGFEVAAFLQDICHREDPTRPVTCGMDQVKCALENGFAEVLDIVGLNYRTFLYQEAFETLPQKAVLGSETASTVSSRGIYKFPAELRSGAMYDDHQCSSYDLEYCWWSNIPDIDFALAEDFDWTMGQFVWTGFDYLGEPTPYDTKAWPSHSSMFGIIDLASIPKDRYWLYRSLWNEDSPTTHLLPHWSWPGREGEKTPVFCYTSYPVAELFVNGVSQGVAQRDTTLLGRYRLRWEDVIYEPGELKVVTFDGRGVEMDSETIYTAGEPAGIVLTTDRHQIAADGRDLAYINVKIVDAAGNLCPTADNLVNFKVVGSGSYRASANGDATCTYLFHEPQMPAFSGQLTAIVQSGKERGIVTLEATSKGLTSAIIDIKVR